MILWDRRKVYAMLRKHGIPTAKHFVVDRPE